MDGSELRKDFVSGDWVVIAPGRAKRHEHPVSISSREITPVDTCPFEHVHEEGPLLQYGEGAAWRVAIIENKYPALRHSDTCPTPSHVGIYKAMQGSGDHALLLTRDHHTNIPGLSPEAALETLQALQEYYRKATNDQCVKYIAILQNWGLSAGASQSHPHFQMLSLPIVPPHVSHSLHHSKHFFEKEGRCAHCAIIEFEKKDGRLVYENNSAIVIAPYASKQAYELRLYPKDHLPAFEKTPADTLSGVTLALQTVLARVRDRLSDPDYNLFIHTAPVGGGENHYHWHIGILPRINISAGFELSTQIIINPVAPEEAARLLK